MASTIKVDTIQDQDGNNIINENADVITVGASGDTITIPAGATFDSSAATNTLPSNVVTTDGTQTLTNKSIATTQLTGTITPSDSTVTLAKLTATGTQDATTFLRGDNTFATPAGGTNTPAFNVWKASNQTISSETLTKVTFSDEEFDTNNNFASSRFTPTVAGYYQINASLDMTNAATNVEDVSVHIYKNGAKYKSASWNGPSGTSALSDSTQTVSTVVYMNGSSDYLEVYALEKAGGSPLAVGNSDKRTHFSGFKLT